MPALARSHDPITSHLAAEQVERGNATSHRKLLLDAVAAAPGHTAAELAQMVGLTDVQARKRLPELREYMHVINGPRRKCAVAGNQQMVWLPVKAPNLTQKGFWK